MTKNLRVNATFLWDGMVAGTWRAERKRAAATLIASPFAPLPAGVEAALAAEGEALLGFLEEEAPTREVRFEAPI